MKNIFKKLKNRRLKTYHSMRSDNFIVMGNQAFIDFAGQNKKKKDNRKDKKPVEVWEKLKNIKEPRMDLSDLDEKIKIVKKRIKILSEYVAEADLDNEYAVIGYLEARKKYNKYKNYFAYPTTNQDLIDDLCREYKLKVVSVNMYSGTMPAEAIDELYEFKNICRKIRKDKPIVRLIVPDTEETEKKKKDPIVLVSSPFGNWDYIIGAWDKEVLVVDELIYEYK